MTNPFSPVLDACREILTAVDEPMAREFVGLLERAATEPATAGPKPCPFPDLARITGLATGRTAAAAAALLAGAPQMPWRRPDPAVVPPGWAERAATVELVGPDGAIAPQANERFGIFLLDTDVHYPAHWHDAEEFYIVLAGSGEWTVEGTTATLGPGAYSRTPSRAHHAIATREQPVFTAYGWSGDTSYDSYGF